MSNVRSVWEQVVDKLLRMIQDNIFIVGEKLPTEQQLMEEFDVGRNTIRKAISCLKAMQIVEVKHGSGVYLKQSVLTTAQEKIRYHIGAILTDEGYFSKVVSGMQNACLKNGCRLHVKFVDNHKQEVEEIKKMIQDNIDVIIITPLRTKNKINYSNYYFLQSKNIKFVMLGKPPVSIFCNCVYCEDTVPSVLAVRKLREANCEKIMHIYNSNLDSVAVSERLHGFTLGVEKYYSKIQYNLLDLARSDYKEQLEKFLLQGDGKAGIFLHADAYFGVVDKIIDELELEYGKDVSVIGYGRDMSKQEIIKGLSTFEIPKLRIGEEIIAQAIGVIEESGEAASKVNHIVFKPEFIRGNTV